MDAQKVRPGVVWAPEDLKLAAAFAAALVGSFFFLPAMSEPTSEWVLLTLLGVIASLSGHADRSPWRLSVPFVSTACLAFGAMAAVVTSVVITLAAELTLNAYRGSKSSAEGLFRSSIPSLVAATVSGLLVTWIFGSTISGALPLALHSLAYVSVWAGVHRGVEALIRSDSMSESAPLLAILFFALPLAGATLVSEHSILFAPLILGPILAAHALLRARTRLHESSDQTVRTLALMLQRSHPYTQRHIERVAEVSYRVARRLGISPARAELVKQAAVLHDVGKIAVDEEILDLPRKLTSDEYDHVKQHAAFGADILGEVECFGEVSKWVRHHHERPDGRGYPDGLLDPEIPLESKIVAIADAYDAMTGGFDCGDPRPFRPPLSPSEAMAELERCAHSQFDPTVVAAFKQAIGGGR